MRITAALFLFFPLGIYAADNGVFTYEVAESSIEITGCVSTCPSNIEIPSTINDIAVTSIGEWAFYNKQITSVVIPESVVEIKTGAFSTNSISSLTLSNSVTLVEQFAFENNQINSLTLSENLTEIHKYQQRIL